MRILSIDTSCDETSAAVTEERKVLSSIVYSQVLLHKEFNGVMPSLAKRAHQERIDWVINEALLSSKSSWDDIDAIAVTYGPGLAIALEVGINKAIELSQQHNKKIIRVNHMEGHIYSCFTQNSKGTPDRTYEFPYLVLLVSGGHTELVLMKDHVTYEVLGETRDDAAGEALDKAARMIGFGYPGGPIIERLAKEVENEDVYKFPRPMTKSEDLDFSYSGLKTSFLYFVKNLPESEKIEKLNYLASSFQEAVFISLIKKTEKAILQTGVTNLLVGGGVAVNKRLRNMMRALAKKHKGQVYFPSYKYLNFDNAAMIGVAAHYRAEKGLFITDTKELDRVPRLSLLQSTVK